MSIVPPDRIHTTLYMPDGVRKVAWLSRAKNRAWRDPLGGSVGVSSFDVPLERTDGSPDPVSALIDWRMIVKHTWVHRGYPIAVFGSRIETEAAELAVDGRRWLRFENQPQLFGMLADARVQAERGTVASSSDTRQFGPSSADGNWRIDHHWHTPRGYPMSAETGHRKGHPPELRKSNPDWIAAQWPATHQPPETVNWYRTPVTLTVGKYTQLIVTADNFLDVWLDNEQIVTADVTNPFGWQHAQVIPLHLAAGDHLFAFKVKNAPLADGSGGNPMGLIFDLQELDAKGKVVGSIVKSAIDGTTIVHDATPQPGWHRAQVLRNQFLEAQARFVHGPDRLTCAFTDFHDSTGAPWVDRDSFSLDVEQQTLADVALMLGEHAIDVWVDARTMRLKATRRRGKDLSATVQFLLGDDGGNLMSHAPSSHGPLATVLYARAADGTWVETIDAAAVSDWGRIEGSYDFGSAADELTVKKIAGRQLDRLSRPETTYTSRSSTNTGIVPYKDCRLGDTVGVRDQRNNATGKARIYALNLQETESGVEAWTEFIKDTVT